MLNIDYSNKQQQRTHSTVYHLFTQRDFFYMCVVVVYIFCDDVFLGAANKQILKLIMHRARCVSINKKPFFIITTIIH